MKYISEIPTISNRDFSLAICIHGQRLFITKISGDMAYEEVYSKQLEDVLTIFNLTEEDTVMLILKYGE